MLIPPKEYLEGRYGSQVGTNWRGIADFVKQSWQNALSSHPELIKYEIGHMDYSPYLFALERVYLGYHGAGCGDLIQSRCTLVLLDKFLVSRGMAGHIAREFVALGIAEIVLEVERGKPPRLYLIYNRSLPVEVAVDVLLLYGPGHNNTNVLLEKEIEKYGIQPEKG